MVLVENVGDRGHLDLIVTNYAFCSQLLVTPTRQDIYEICSLKQLFVDTKLLYTIFHALRLRNQVRNNVTMSQ